MRDMTTIEIIPLNNFPETYDPKNPVEWSGPVEEFMDNNELTEDEIEQFVGQGYIIMGGGAQPMVCVRYKDVRISGECANDLYYGNDRACPCERCIADPARRRTNWGGEGS